MLKICNNKYGDNIIGSVYDLTFDPWFFFLQKTFCPTIPSGRRVNKGPSSEEKLTKPERWTEDRKRPNIKKERMKREIIQSASVFSLGPAGKPSQGTAWQRSKW